MYISPATRNHSCINYPELCIFSFLKAIFEALEETIYHLRCQLKEKELELNKTRTLLAAEIMKKDKLSQIIRYLD
jgi:hypothetical protein